MQSHRFPCKDCGYSMGPEDHFSLRDSLWTILADDREDILCILCCEKRAGRQLDVYDFQALLINLSRIDSPKSHNLLERLGDFKDRMGVGAIRAVEEIMRYNARNFPHLGYTYP